MDKWDADLLKFLNEQDEEFLQKVKGQKAYLFSSIMDKKPKIVARFLAKGRIVVLPFCWEILFSQSFSPNHGVYEFHRNEEHYYVGVKFDDDLVFIYMTHDFDRLFVNNAQHVILAKHSAKDWYDATSD